LSEISTTSLCIILGFCILLSAFFAGSETAMMSVNRYRLRHLVSRRHRGASRTSALLERTDRLIGLLLIGNTFINILASAVATVLGLRLYGEGGLILDTLVLTIVLLIFSEVGPKTVAALYPERIAFPASFVLVPLLKVMYPLVWAVNCLANGLLRLLGIRPQEAHTMSLSREELRTVVKEAGAMIPRRHQQMLFGILDLEKATVEDIMIPRNDIIGIDLDNDPSEISERLVNCVHTRVPVYRERIDNLIGMLHVRQLPRLVKDQGMLDLEALQRGLSKPYFVPMGTQLHTQLSNFQHLKQRSALVVDEYGDIQGLVTLEDILEEIVGEFTTDPLVFNKDISEESPGVFLIDGGASIRDINRSLRWRLPSEGARTLNGLILETLETIPEPGTTLRIKHYTVEILQTQGQAVKTVRIVPSANPTPPPDPHPGSLPH
jgi:Mg2+/Co2+ transporter CorB